MKRSILKLGCVMVVLGALPAFGMSNSKQYKECTALTRSDAKAALSMAEQWVRKENTASASHCRAIALFALKRYQQAGDALDRLSVQIGQDNLMLWANVLRQSSKAWELADEKAKSIIAITKAIGPTSSAGIDNPAIGRLASELLRERSRLYTKGGRHLYAVQDLDQALMLNPSDEKLLLARAKVFITLKESDMARQDLKLVLHKQPSNAEALGLMARVK